MEDARRRDKEVPLEEKLCPNAASLLYVDACHLAPFASKLRYWPLKLWYRCVLTPAVAGVVVE